MQPIDLKGIERKAFRTTYEDGLWDIYLGLMLMSMAIFLARPESGFSPQNILLMLGCFTLAYLVFWAGKKYITLPRMGQVVFGPSRRRKKRTLIVVLSILVLAHLGIVLLSIFGRTEPESGARLSAWLGSNDSGQLLVAALGSFFVGPSMLLIAYFTDFARGYYIAILMSMGVFLMLWLNKPLYPILLAGLILIPGLVLFILFLKKYPIRGAEEPHG